MDKKLIVESKKIVVASKGKKKPNFTILIDAMEYIPKLFQKIAINELRTQNNAFSILYENQKFTLKNKDLLLIASFIKEEDRILTIIHRGKYKPFNISLQAKGVIAKEFLQFKGEYTFEGIQGSFKLHSLKDGYTFFANSKVFTNRQLKRIFSHFALHPEIKKWSYENIVAKRYKLNYITLFYSPKSGFQAKNLKALATAHNVKVHFHPSLPSAHVKKVLMHLRNDALHFKLIQPTYQNKSLKGSYVTIKELTKPKRSNIKIVIKTLSPFDETVARLLRAYDVEIPIKQTQGKIDAKVLISIHFASKKIDISGDFHTSDAKILLKDIPVSMPQSHLVLQNKKIVLKNSPVGFFDIFQTHTKGLLDLQQKRGKFLVKIDKARLKRDGFILFDMNDVTEQIYIDLSKNRLFAKRFNIEAVFDDTKSIHIYDLNALLPYSSFLQRLTPFKADLHLQLQKSGITFASKVVKNNEILFYRNKPVSTFNIEGKITAHKTTLKINDFITATIAKDIHITCRNLTCKVPKNSTTSTIQKPIKATLYNSTLLYEDRQIPFEKASVQIDPNNILLEGKYHKGRIVFKKDNNFSLEAKNIDADFVNRFLNKVIFKGGNFAITAKGDMKKFHATTRFSQTYIKNLKALNNIFAFVNSIPSLITFSNPGFNTEGLFVKRGVVDFDYDRGIIIVKNLFLESYSLNLAGSGILNLKNMQLNMHIKLITFKSITNILNKIPVAGYILLGKDGTAYTTLHLTGDIEDPKVTTQLTKETLQLPFNIIKRTLQLPFKLFE